MPRTHTARRLLLLGAAALLPLGAVACSSDSDSGSPGTTTASQAYCSAWSDLVTAFGQYDQIDIINGGMDSVRSYFDQLESAAQDLQSSSDSLIGPKVEAFTTSLEDLGTTLTSPSLPVDRTAQVRQAKGAVDDAWNELVGTVKTSCPDVTASTV